MTQIYLASQTLIRMEQAVEADQGARYRENLKQVLPHISDAYRGEEDGHRSHMGASVLGRDCGRAIWYNFRWAMKAHFSGRMMRLFNRGHLEEGRFIALLLTIGCQVFQQDADGKQYRISFGDGHAGGSGDGVVMGLPDLAPGTPALGEFKTHNKKSFEKLAGDDWKDYVAHLLDPGKPKVQFSGVGVREAKFEHYVQANLYMRKMGIAVCLYVAVNKDDDAIYCELIPLDVTVADQFIQRADNLIPMSTPPAKINESPGFWKCKFCDYRPVCHLKETPDRNCRTCAHSSPGLDGAWGCSMHEKILTKAEQLAACPEYSVRKAF